MPHAMNFYAVSRNHPTREERSVCDARPSLMKAETSTTLRAFVLELAVYAVLVTGYFFLVLHFLSGWLQELHLHHVKTYAVVAIALIIGQAVLLESVTTWLFRLIRGRSE
jgi:hypothetical protein